MISLQSVLLSKAELGRFEKKWGTQRIIHRQPCTHPHYDKIRLTKVAQKRMVGLTLENFIDGQNKEELVERHLRYVPVIVMQRRTPILIGAIVTLDQARTILRKNKIDPNTTDMHDLEGKAYIYRQGIWIAVDLEQSAQ